MLYHKKELKVGQRLTLPPGCKAWVVKNSKDLAEEREINRQNGRFMDDGGEPILYAEVKELRNPFGLEVIVGTKRPEWTHWTKKPSFLVGGYVPSMERSILFVMPADW